MPHEYLPRKHAHEPVRRRGLWERIKSNYISFMCACAQLAAGFGLRRLAARIYNRQIHSGSTHAMLKLGQMYWWGYKFTRDPVKAIELIEYAAIRGNLEALRFKEDMTADGLWRQGKIRDEFMDEFDEQIVKEKKQNRPVHLIMALFYTLVLIGLAYFLRK